MKFILVQLSTLFLSLVLSHSREYKLTKDQQQKYNYYQNILEQNLNDENIKLKFDQDGLYLTNTNEYIKHTTIAKISKKHIISGCNFYPFRDWITQLIKKYFSEKNLDAEIKLPFYTIV